MRALSEGYDHKLMIQLMLDSQGVGRPDVYHGALKPASLIFPLIVNRFRKSNSCMKQ